MHFRGEDVWNRLAEASRDDGVDLKAMSQDVGESTSERKMTKKKLRKPNVLMAVPTIYVS